MTSVFVPLENGFVHCLFDLSADEISLDSSKEIEGAEILDGSSVEWNDFQDAFNNLKDNDTMQARRRSKYGIDYKILNAKGKFEAQCISIQDFEEALPPA